jgi:hypothetical protein
MAATSAASDWVGLGTPGQSPEATSTAARGYFNWPFHLSQGQWTMPASNRLLLDANMTVFRYNPAFGFPAPDRVTGLIPATQQSTALRCVRAGQHVEPGLREADEPETLRWAPQANYRYRALEQWGYAEGRDQLRQRERVVRHRFAQHEGRLSVLLAATARQNHRGREPAPLSLQRGQSERGHLPPAGVEPQLDHAAARLLRPGQLHARPSDAVGRAPLRPGEQLRAGRGERHVDGLVPEPQPHHHRADDWRRCLSRPLASRGRRLRRLR